MQESMGRAGVILPPFFVSVYASGGCTRERLRALLLRVRHGDFNLLQPGARSPRDPELEPAEFA